MQMTMNGKTRRGVLRRAVRAVVACGACAALVAGLAACSDGTAADHTLAQETFVADGALNGYSWDELAKISAEIAAAGSESEATGIAQGYGLANTDGTIDSTQVKEVSITKEKDGINLGNVEGDEGNEKLVTTARVRVIGFSHDDKADGTKAGLTFQFVDCVGDYNMNTHPTNEGGWEKSGMRAYLNGAFLDELPEDLVKVLAEVSKQTNNAGCTADAASVTATTDKMWLPSLIELTGDQLGAYLEAQNQGAASTVLAAEGSQYQLFKEKGVEGADNPVLAKASWPSSYGSSRNTENGKTWQWWQRSANPLSGNQFYNVYYNGNPCYETFNGSVVFGIAPCFSI